MQNNDYIQIKIISASKKLKKCIARTKLLNLNLVEGLIHIDRRGVYVISLL